MYSLHRLSCTMLWGKSTQSTCYSHHKTPHHWKGQKKVHPYGLNINKLRLDIAGALQKGFKYLFSHFSSHKDLSSISREKDLWTAALIELVPSISAHFFVKSKSNLQPLKFYSQHFQWEFCTLPDAAFKSRRQNPWGFLLTFIHNLLYLGWSERSHSHWKHWSLVQIEMPPHTDQMSRKDLHCKVLLVFQGAYTSLVPLHIPRKSLDYFQDIWPEQLAPLLQ